MNKDQIDALTRHGYPAGLQPRGSTGKPEQVITSFGLTLRNRVCELDGIEIDGHVGADASTFCIFCGDEGDDPWG